MATALNATPMASRPTRARGLKFVTDSTLEENLVSRPTRARGLKSILADRRGGHLLSRPTRARGLKFHFIAQRRFAL